MTKKGKINIVVLPNPSHLDTINPVCEGYTRAAQKYESVRTDKHVDRTK